MGKNCENQSVNPRGIYGVSSELLTLEKGYKGPQQHSRNLKRMLGKFKKSSKYQAKY